MTVRSSQAARTVDSERRRRPRTTQENRATTFVEAVLDDPKEAVRMLDEDLDAGGDSAVLFGVLDAAEASLRLRGVDDLRTIRALRAHLQRRVERG